MGLRFRLARYETLGEFERARVQRVNDADTLDRAGHRMGAMYMLGYAGEMALKCAYYRFDRVQEHERLDLPRLRTTKQKAKQLSVTVPNDAFHNPVFWAELIVETRCQAGLPLDNWLSRELSAKSQRMYSNWKPAMRYCSDRATRREYLKLRTSVYWITEYYGKLWRI